MGITCHSPNTSKRVFVDISYCERLLWITKVIPCIYFWLCDSGWHRKSLLRILGFKFTTRPLSVSRNARIYFFCIVATIIFFHNAYYLENGACNKQELCNCCRKLKLHHIRRVESRRSEQTVRIVVRIRVNA